MREQKHIFNLIGNQRNDIIMKGMGFQNLKRNINGWTCIIGKTIQMKIQRMRKCNICLATFRWSKIINLTNSCPNKFGQSIFA